MTTPSTMYDAVTVANLPAYAEMVAGYVDGAYANVAELERRFPGARIVTITTGLGEADVIDIESGNAVPSNVPGWVRRMRSLHRRPIVYTTPGNWQAVLEVCHGTDVAPPFWWAAHWTNVSHLEPGSVATQWASPITWPRIGYDISEVAPGFPERYEKEHPVSKPVTTIKTPTKQAAASIARQAAAVTAIVTSLTHTLPAPDRVWGFLLGGLLLGIEHFVADPSTGTPAPPADES
jgi:hypothetical protein